MMNTGHKASFYKITLFITFVLISLKTYANNQYKVSDFYGRWYLVDVVHNSDYDIASSCLKLKDELSEYFILLNEDIYSYSDIIKIEKPIYIYSNNEVKIYENKKKRDFFEVDSLNEIHSFVDSCIMIYKKR